MKPNFVLIIMALIPIMIFSGCDLDLGLDPILGENESPHQLGDIHVMVYPGTFSLDYVHCTVISCGEVEFNSNLPWEGDHYCFKTQRKEGIVSNIRVEGYQNNQIVASSETGIYTFSNSTTTITMVLQ